MDAAAQQRWFTEEILPHESALKAYLRKRFPDLNEVDDLVQESYVKLLTAGQKGPIKSTRAYLFTIARNAAISRLRGPHVFSDQSLDAPKVQAVSSDDPDVMHAVARKQEIAILGEAIASLPSRCREIFVQVKLQGMSHQAVADWLGLSVDTVHAQVARGLKKCTEYLREHGVLEEMEP